MQQGVYSYDDLANWPGGTLDRNIDSVVIPTGLRVVLIGNEMAEGHKDQSVVYVSDASQTHDYGSRFIVDWV